MRFVPLHLYSGYSFLRSGLSIHKILLNAKKAGYSQVGLSDFETLPVIQSSIMLSKIAASPLLSAWTSR